MQGYKARERLRFTHLWSGIGLLLTRVIWWKELKFKNKGSDVWLPALKIPGDVTLANNIICLTFNFLICQMVIIISASQDYSGNGIS